MKNLIFTLLFVTSLGSFKSQTLNSKGLYVDSDGELFNGKISQTQNQLKSDFIVKEGMIEGEATYYYASGNIMESGFYKDGKKDQKWTRYNENGTVSAIGFYALGKKSGTWLVYDDAGIKRFEMTYTEGEKTGVWTNWDEKGSIVSTKDYSKVN